ncbi:MAG TPA: ABC transporter substrate-binding protein [Stellaceae bacterium]|nr:ABC transporter substrate-binding protein [Stellaceae bacterium]
MTPVRILYLCVIAIVTTASAMIAPAAAEDTPGVTKDKITVGGFGPLTGPSYLYGKLFFNGVEAVLEKVNAEGGINGRKVELVREDDRCDPATAIAAVKKLISLDQVFSISGGGCSNAALAARAEIEDAGVPWLVTGVADGLTRPIAPRIFSTGLTSSIESEAEVAYVQKHGYKRIAVIAMHDPWGRSRYEPLLEDLKHAGITPVADEELAPDANDATPQVLRLKAANPDAVIMLLFPKPGAVFVRDSAKLAFKPAVIGQTSISDPSTFEDQVGMPGATANFVTIAQVRYTPVSPEMTKWSEAIAAKYPGDRLSNYNLNGIGHGEVLVEALRRAGANLTRESFITALMTLRDFPTDTYGGGITCTKEEHRCNKTPVWLHKDPGGPVKVIDITKVE